MRTLRRPAALAAGFALTAIMAVAYLPSGPPPAEARSPSLGTWMVDRLAEWQAQPFADTLAALRQCESGGNYRSDTGNGYFGAYQFSTETWQSLGYGGLPHQAPPKVQDAAALRLQSSAGWAQWPACADRLGLA